MDMTLQELKKTNPLYAEYQSDWQLYGMVYEGGTDLVEYALTRHPRESEANHKARVKDGYCFNFGKAIIDIFNFYLNQNDANRDLPDLKDDPLWAMFEKDTDLHGTDYENFWIEAHKFASVYGAIGILVNKPGSPGVTQSTDIDNKIYPYYAMYLLPNILDWEFTFNPTNHRHELTYLKLFESDGTYTRWFLNRWERWQIDPSTNQPKLVAQGEYNFGEIPFLWLQNIRNIVHPNIGVSDLVDIAPIVISVTNNLSCGEEIIKFAGFPMMRLPMEREGVYTDASNEVPTGPQAIFEYDPSMGEAGKPDWMPTEIKEPIEAVLAWIDRKADEIYRIAHLSGVHGQRRSNNEVASGLALRYEFSQLNSVLVSKSTNLTEAELTAFKYWLKWAGKEEVFVRSSITRSNRFNIDELSVALDNAITSMGTIMSKKFREIVQIRLVKNVTPDISPKELDEIVREIEQYTPEGNIPMNLPGQKGGYQTPMVKTANDAADGGASKGGPTEKVTQTNGGDTQ